MDSCRLSWTLFCELDAAGLVVDDLDAAGRQAVDAVDAAGERGGSTAGHVDDQLERQLFRLGLPMDSSSPFQKVSSSAAMRPR